jgi:anaerobic dimethyl sulfoxide reductase subunit C (anchor subunit)
LRNKDWTLVFFTTLSQLSVGIILCFTWLVYVENDARVFIELGLTLKNPVFLALISIGLATIISFSHLGNPSNAPKSLNNLTGSWVSREILALAVYSISLLIVFVLGWKNWNVQYLQYLLILSSVFGLVFLWMMIRIYIIPTIPPWNSWYTGLSFITTTACLGLITILFLQYNLGCLTCDEKLIDGVGCVTCYARVVESQTGKTLTISLIIIVLIEIISGFVHQSRLQKMNTGIDDLILNKGTFYQVFLIRMVMLILALLALFAFLFTPTLLPENNYFTWIYPLLVLLIAQELTGRLLFYSSYFRIGV